MWCGLGQECREPWPCALCLHQGRPYQPNCPNKRRREWDKDKKAPPQPKEPAAETRSEGVKDLRELLQRRKSGGPVEVAERVVQVAAAVEPIIRVATPVSSGQLEVYCVQLGCTRVVETLPQLYPMLQHSPYPFAGGGGSFGCGDEGASHAGRALPQNGSQAHAVLAAAHRGANRRQKGRKGVNGTCAVNLSMPYRMVFPDDASSDPFGLLPVPKNKL